MKSRQSLLDQINAKIKQIENELVDSQKIIQNKLAEIKQVESDVQSKQKSLESM